MTKPNFSYIETIESKCALTEFGKNALVEAINKDNNYERDLIQREFLRVLAIGIASSVISNKDSKDSRAIVKTPFDENNPTMNRGEVLQMLEKGLTTSIVRNENKDSEDYDDNYLENLELEEIHKWCPNGWCPKGRHETHYCVNSLFNPDGIAYDDGDYSTGESGAYERVLAETICGASRLALDSERNCGLPLTFNSEPSGHFIMLEQLMEYNIFPCLNRESLRSLAMACKWTNDVVNNSTFNGVALICARDYNMKSCSSIGMKNIYDFMRHISEVCTTVSTDTFTRHSQDYINQKQTYFEIMRAIDHGEASLFENAGCYESWMSASARKGFLIKVDSKLFTVGIELRRENRTFSHGSWEDDRYYENPADAPIGEFKAFVRIKVASTESEQKDEEADSKSEGEEEDDEELDSDKSPHSSKNNIKKSTVKEDGSVANEAAFADILKSQTCFSHQRHDYTEFPMGIFFSLDGCCLSLEEICLLSNKGVFEVLESLNCNEVKFNEYCDPDTWFGIESDDNECFSDKMLKLFQELIVSLVDISFGGLSNEGRSCFMNLLEGKKLDDEECRNLPLQTLKFKPRKWPLWQPRKWPLWQDGEWHQTCDDENSGLPLNWYELFTCKKTINDGYIVFQN